jgi:hypothetical protein
MVQIEKVWMLPPLKTAMQPQQAVNVLLSLRCGGQSRSRRRWRRLIARERVLGGHADRS